MEYPNNCTLCPRECRADRTHTKGACGMSNVAVVARTAPHEWEEPCISGKSGSGTVFFSGCSLKCVFCQNHEISHGNIGCEVSDEKLAEIFLKLEEIGCHNINLVNPTHFVPNIINALELAKPHLKIPVVWNTGGYEKSETLKMLAGYVDIFLPDLKYVSTDVSLKYSGAKNYFEYASDALDTMFELVGYPQFDSSGMMKSGVLVRHLVLPSHVAESKKVIDHLAENYDTKKLWVSLMCQYFPTYRAFEFPEISRKLTTLEYQRVCQYARDRGITNGFLQDKASAAGEYVPQFSEDLKL